MSSTSARRWGFRIGDGVRRPEVRARATQMQVQTLHVRRVRALRVLGAFERLLVLAWIADQLPRGGVRDAAARVAVLDLHVDARGAERPLQTRGKST